MRAMSVLFSSGRCDHLTRQSSTCLQEFGLTVQPAAFNTDGSTTGPPIRVQTPHSNCPRPSIFLAPPGSPTTNAPARTSRYAPQRDLAAASAPTRVQECRCLRISTGCVCSSRRGLHDSSAAPADPAACPPHVCSLGKMCALVGRTGCATPLPADFGCCL